MRQRHGLLMAAGFAFALAAGVVILRSRRAQPPAFGGGNGRLEAVDVDVATKTAGRLLSVVVQEGDLVRAGQVLARMDPATVLAQLEEARADQQRALTQVQTSRSQLVQRRDEERASAMVVAQRQAERDLAEKRFQRSSQLVQTGALSAEIHDTDAAKLLAARAAFSQARADREAHRSAITTATSEVRSAEAAAQAAAARSQRLRTELNDMALTAPKPGRVQIRIAEPGEVLAAGGRVLNLLDLSDVYMTVFLPTEEAGRVRIGAPARLRLDAAPTTVLPGAVSYVASKAQFTPKTVETRRERQKLMFRVKVRLAPELVRRHLQQVKTGMPGEALVQLDPQARWPAGWQLRPAPASEEMP
jgi:HlyD family secretion protein